MEAQSMSRGSPPVLFEEVPAESGFTRRRLPETRGLTLLGPWDSPTE